MSQNAQFSRPFDLSPSIDDAGSGDFNILLLLLSFLSPDARVPLDLLHRGATPRMRWTVEGESTELGATQCGLFPALKSLLLDLPRTCNAMSELSRQSAVSESDQIYSVNEEVATRIRESLSMDLSTFWRYQALIISYRAIPWKYLETTTPHITLFLPHLEHTLHALEGNLDGLQKSTKIDLAHTLIEASRFPSMRWKRFAVGQAELAAQGLGDAYLEACVAQSRCVLARISGKLEEALRILNGVNYDSISSTQRNMHSAMGLTAIQQSLNHVQVEELSAAQEVLDQWNPITNPSQMENVVLFRKSVMLGKILRYKGEFEESLTHLKRAWKAAEQHGFEIFDEDMHDLACELGDTLRELSDPVSAEKYLRMEINRSGKPYVVKPLLLLSLAESLFAQDRFPEAEALCKEVESRPGLLKFEKLRLQIIMAKTRHVESNFKEAMAHWRAAVQEIRKYPMTNGLATRMIILSISEALRHLGELDNMRQSLKQVETLDKLAKPDSVQHWIAGTQHWMEYLRTVDARGDL